MWGREREIGGEGVAGELIERVIISFRKLIVNNVSRVQHVNRVKLD